MRLLFALTVLILAWTPFAEPAAAARSVALVIGNADYDVAPLRNPINDAEAMAETLRRMGFDDVVVAKDLDLGQMNTALAAFAAKARGADTALIFYAGHGMEIGGDNYLIPSGPGLSSPDMARYQAIRLDDAVAAVASASRLAVVIVDACRDNPWGGGRGTRGLARVEATPGMVVAFSTAPGDLAQDGAGALSPYTTALTEKLARSPELDVRRLFTSLGARTRELAGAPQRPWSNFGELPEGDVPLLASAFAPTNPTPAPAAPPRPEPAAPNRPTRFPPLDSAAAHSDSIFALTAAPDGRIVTGAGDGALKIWSIANDRLRLEATLSGGHRDKIYSLAITPDSRFALSGDRLGQLALWDLRAARLAQRWPASTSAVFAIAITADGARAVTAGWDAHLAAWEVGPGAPFWRVEAQSRDRLSLALDPRGAWVATSGRDREIKIYDMRTGEPIRILAGHTGDVWALAAAADGRLFSGGSEGMLKSWDVANGRVIQEIKAHEGWVRAIAIAPTGGLLATGGSDGEVRFWDRASGRLLGAVDAHNDAYVLGVAFTPDGRYALSAGGDGALKLWGLR